MAESVYTVVELIGTSTQSWEKAAAAAVKQASQSLRDLRVAEVVELDMALDEGKVTAYRAKVKHVSREGLKDWSDAIEVGWVGAHHRGEGAL